jgi:hypothetical protein
MKKFLFPVMMVGVMLTLNYASSRVNAAGNSMYSLLMESCDQKTVKMEQSSLLGLTTAVEVEGWKCNGSDKAGQGYRSQIYDHFFHLL